MSFFPGKDPAAGDRFACDALETVVVPRSVDLDGFSVRRALPHASRRTVGPFVFFDHFGPAEFKSGHGLDVRPHPHIGLSTLTYLYDGEIIHRDSLGVKAAIHPGAVNWMTAGRGIVHSERTAPEHRVMASRCMACSSGSACRARRKRSTRALPISMATSCRRQRRGQDRSCRRRFDVRHALAAQDHVGDAVRRCLARCGHHDAARCRVRGARHLYRGGRARYFRRQVRRQASFSCSVRPTASPLRRPSRAASR